LKGRLFHAFNLSAFGGREQQILAGEQRDALCGKDKTNSMTRIAPDYAAPRRG
jgi:hypothetical protein